MPAQPVSIEITLDFYGCVMACVKTETIAPNGQPNGQHKTRKIASDTT